MQGEGRVSGLAFCVSGRHCNVLAFFISTLTHRYSPSRRIAHPPNRREIKRLSSLLAAETSRSERLSREARRWKESATELSDSLRALAEGRDEVISKLACWKKMFKLRPEVSEKGLVPHKGGFAYC